MTAVMMANAQSTNCPNYGPYCSVDAAARVPRHTLPRHRPRTNQARHLHDGEQPPDRVPRGVRWGHQWRSSCIQVAGYVHGPGPGPPGGGAEASPRTFCTVKHSFLQRGDGIRAR